MISRRDALKLGAAGLMLPAIGSAFPSGISAMQATSGDVPMYRGNAARTGEMPGPAPDISNGIGVRWQFAADSPVRTSPAVVDGIAYFGSDDGSLHAVTLQDGAEIWRFATGNSVASSPAVVDGAVFFGSEDQNCYAVEASTGDERWRLPIGPYSGAPAVVDGTVLVNGGEQGQMNLFALDAHDGSERWRFAVDAYSGLIPAVADGTVFLSTGTNLHALELRSGEEVWRVPTETPSQRFEMEIAVVNNAVVAGFSNYDTHAESVVAFDTRDGSERWRTVSDLVIGGIIAVTDDTVFGGSFAYHSVQAVNAQDGSEQWLYFIQSAEPYPPTPSRYGFSHVAVADDTVFATRAFTEVYAFDLQDGSERWKFDLPEGGKNVVTAPVIVDGLVLVGCSAGSLYALGAL